MGLGIDPKQDAEDIFLLRMKVGMSMALLNSGVPHEAHAIAARQIDERFKGLLDWPEAGKGAKIRSNLREIFEQAKLTANAR